jgi:hypothetical protein
MRESKSDKAGEVVLCLRARANGRVGSITTTPHTNSLSPKNHTTSLLKTLRRLFFHVPTTGTLGRFLAGVRFGVEEDNAATERHGKAPGTFIWSAKYTVCWQYPCISSKSTKPLLGGVATLCFQQHDQFIKFLPGRFAISSFQQQQHELPKSS